MQGILIPPVRNGRWYFCVQLFAPAQQSERGGIV
nr:MAG TPA: hypothetical protein [Caudoviricetes sp.]